MTHYLSALEAGDPPIPAADAAPPARESGDTADLEATGDTPLSFARAVTALDIIQGWASVEPMCWWPGGALMCEALARPAAWRLRPGTSGR
jgi:hypothetical protein